jgi:hypothetical protein
MAHTGSLTVASQPAKIVPPASYSAYLSARPLSPPTARVKTLAESPSKSREQEAARQRLLEHSRALRSASSADPALQGGLSVSVAGAGAAIAQGTPDKWARSWTREVVALNVGLRRPAVLPVATETAELLSTDHERRLAEADRQVLLNRVRSLQGQEQRAAMRIALAEDKLEQVRHVRAQLRVRKGARDELKAAVAAQRYEEAQEKRDQHRRAQATVAAFKEQVGAQKQQQRARLQQERRDAEALRQQVRTADEAARHAAASVVRAQSRLAQQRRHAATLARQAAVEDERAARLRQAEEQRDAALGDMEALERAEAELLQRLQARKAQHESVYKELAAELQPSAVSGRGFSFGPLPPQLPAPQFASPR